MPCLLLFLGGADIEEKHFGGDGDDESRAVALQAFMFSSLGDTDVHALISLNNELRGAVLSLPLSVTF